MNRDGLRDMVAEDYRHESARTKFDRHLQMAEARIQNDVQSREIEKSDYGTLDKPFIEIPDDWLAPLRLVLYRGSQEVSTLFAAAGPVENRTRGPGKPKTFFIQDQVIMLYPSPGQGYEYALYYIPMIRPLTINAPENYILSRAPNIYRYAVLAECAIHLRDTEGQANYLGLYDQAWASYQSAQNRGKYPLHTPIRMRMRSRL